VIVAVVAVQHVLAVVAVRGISRVNH
jgi:hypothetical protein